MLEDYSGNRSLSHSSQIRQLAKVRRELFWDLFQFSIEVLNKSYGNYNEHKDILKSCVL